MIIKQDFFVNLFQNFPNEAATFLIAMLPLAEVRVSIPIAILKFEMHPFGAFFWSVAGNIFMGMMVILIIEPLISIIIEKSKFLKKIWKKYIYRIETKNAKKFNKWGPVALIFFIAIPLPLTGVFTGAVAASVFQIPFLRAAPLIAAGSAIAGIIVTSISLIFNK